MCFSESSFRFPKEKMYEWEDCFIGQDHNVRMKPVHCEFNQMSKRNKRKVGTLCVYIRVSVMYIETAIDKCIKSILGRLSAIT